MLLASSVIKKKKVVSLQLNLSSLFSVLDRLFFRSLEEVISSGDVSEGSTALKST